MSKNQFTAIIFTSIVVTGLWTLIKEFSTLVFFTSAVSSAMIFHTAKYIKNKEDTITIPKSALITPKEVKNSDTKNNEIGFHK